jgi:hypothetical protein
MLNVGGVEQRLAARLDLSTKWRQDPGLWDGIRWRPCVVRILLVADDFLFFSDENFGLSDLIEILATEPFAFARFEITTAHRSATVSDARAGVGNPHVVRAIKGFHFDNADHFNPAVFDQVWLFGAERSRLSGKQWTPKLPDAEIRKLCEFMDGGGGVFATGDHEDLGASLCGFVPRIRAMRKWFFPAPGPNGEPVAPPFEGPGRNDTNRVGHDVGFQFEDQSDDIPQEVEPTWYKAQVGIFLEASWPHPVLCGPNGPIRVLPDHPHESECIVPSNLNWTTTVAGYNITEFPASISGGQKPAPEVLATSTVLGGHTTSGKSGVTVSRTFGAIGGYDGHRAGVGRIIVDSTWHHFLNINLTGDSGQPFPKSVGFLATPAGQAVLEEIKTYFRNIALWISRPARIRCMRNWGLLTVINSHRLHEVFDPFKKIGNAELFDYVALGRHARDALGKYASQCQSLRWTLDLYREVLKWPPRWIDPGDPWRPRLEDREQLPAGPLVNLDFLGDAAIGGAVLAVRVELFPLQKQFEEGIDDRLNALVERGAGAGLKIALDHMQGGLKELSTLKFGSAALGGG